MHKKIAIVTGNKQGLGKAITEKLEAEGFEKISLIGFDDYNLKNQAEAEQLIIDTIKKHGRLDLLVNNVGNYINKPINEFKSDEWHELFDSNLHSAFYTSQKALQELRKSKGAILNIGFASIENLEPSLKTAAYEAAKTSLLIYTKALAKAEAANGVKINMLSPGYLENSVDHPQVGIKKGIPMGRLASLEEASELAWFLINSEYITGQNIELAGGWGL